MNVVNILVNRIRIRVSSLRSKDMILLLSNTIYGGRLVLPTFNYYSSASQLHGPIQWTRNTSEL